jgi:hypothetical protein
MKLGEAKDFYVLREGDTEKFYDAENNVTTTGNLLAAQRFTERDELEHYQRRLLHIHAGVPPRVVPKMVVVHIRITVERIEL